MCWKVSVKHERFLENNKLKGSTNYYVGKLKWNNKEKKWKRDMLVPLNVFKQLSTFTNSESSALTI
jgi:hypothetical protein